MKFTPLQIAFLAFHFEQFADEKLTLEQWANIAQIVADFVGLGDPYDTDLVIEAVKFVTTKVPTEKNLNYFVGKVIYWIEK